MYDVKIVVTKVFCTFQFEGFHQWIDAPDSCSFLRAQHRHLFHVRVVAEVNHVNRDIEFITFKNTLEKTVKVYNTTYKDNVLTWSCEQWCLYIMSLSQSIIEVEVSEDGENGAILTKE